MTAIAWAIIWVASIKYDNEDRHISNTTKFGTFICFIMMVLLTFKELAK